jgi:hypothetical protein
MHVTERPSVATVVVRAWVGSPPGQPPELRYQVTHVQTGRVSYFGSLEGVTRYIDQLSETLEPSKHSYPPIDFAQWRRAAEHPSSV